MILPVTRAKRFYELFDVVDEGEGDPRVAPFVTDLVVSESLRFRQEVQAMLR